ncbi:type II toxin-antitoxin system VapC family toxin [Leptospira sp. 96542]|nr:type II toxin-antitoxin system VapC family toxin [Leptospira sp. 96542]
MKSRIYIETSVISYYTAKLSKDIRTLSRQETTIDWWEEEKSKFNCFISLAVIEEISRGNQDEAQKRLKASESIPILAEKVEIMTLAEKYFSKLNIPEKSKYDTIHIAYASFYEVEYLLSWNMKHISNPRTQSALIDLNLALNLKTPLLITPEALMEIS